MTTKRKTTTTVELPEVMNIQGAAFYLNLSEMRIRRLTTEGKIKATKDEKNRWMFNIDDLVAYKAERENGNSKVNGSAYRIRITDDKLEQVKATLAELGIEIAPIKVYGKKKAGEVEAEAEVEEPVEEAEPVEA